MAVFCPLSCQPVFFQGAAQIGAQITVFDAGTLTPRTAYKDGLLNSPWAQPILSDANGCLPEIWVTGNAYKLRIATAGGVQIREVDNLPGDAAQSTTTDERRRRQLGRIARHGRPSVELRHGRDRRTRARERQHDREPGLGCLGAREPRLPRPLPMAVERRSDACGFRRTRRERARRLECQQDDRASRFQRPHALRHRRHGRNGVRSPRQCELRDGKSGRARQQREEGGRRR